jgi:hypothetical protein
MSTAQPGMGAFTDTKVTEAKCPWPFLVFRRPTIDDPGPALLLEVRSCT